MTTVDTKLLAHRLAQLVESAQTNAREAARHVDRGEHLLAASLYALAAHQAVGAAMDDATLFAACARSALDAAGVPS